MQINVLSSWKDIAAFEPHWRMLSETNGIFQSWDWIENWRQTVSPEIKLYVIVVQDKDQVIGIAPFWLCRYLMAKLIPVNVLRIMGDLYSGAEYPAMLVMPGRAAEVYQSVFAHLRGMSFWDQIWLPKLNEDAALQFRSALSKSGFQSKQRVINLSGISLGPTPEDYLNSLSGNRRQQLRRLDRKFRQLPGVNFERLVGEPEIEEALEQLFNLHNKRWEEKGLAGSFQRNPKMKVFYRRMVIDAAKTGRLLFTGVSYMGNYKALQIGYIDGSTYLQMQEGFDPEFHAGVGNALRWFSVKECIADGVNYYDFLAGDTDHKRRWNATVRNGYDFMVQSRGLIATLSSHFWPTGRWLTPDSSV